MLASKFLWPRFQIVSSQEERMMRDVINSAGLLLLEFSSFLFRLKNIWALARVMTRGLMTFLKDLHLHLIITRSCRLGILLTSLRDYFKAHLRTNRSFALIIWSKLLARFVELPHASAQSSLFLLTFQQEKIFQDDLEYRWLALLHESPVIFLVELVSSARQLVELTCADCSESHILLLIDGSSLEIGQDGERYHHYGE